MAMLCKGYEIRRIQDDEAQGKYYAVLPNGEIVVTDWMKYDSYWFDKSGRKWGKTSEELPDNAIYLGTYAIPKLIE